jgi:hypothetical protein
VIDRTLRADLIIAAVVAALVLIISPGLAISGILAILVMLICAIGVVRAARGGRLTRRRSVKPRRRSVKPRTRPRRGR